MTAPNSNFDQLAAITIARYSSELADNVTNNIPLLMFLKREGNLKSNEVGGGTKILENLRYADNASFKWFNGFEYLSVQPTDDFTAAEFEWKEANANVIFSQRQIAINSGSEEQQFDLIEGKTQSTEDTITNNLGAALFYSNTENDGKSIGGLQHLVADAPTTGTVGNINRATASNAFWRNQIYDFSTEAVTPSAGTMRGAMNALYRRCQRNSDIPGLIIFGDTYMGYFETGVQAQQMFTNSEDADIGFPVLRFKSKTRVIYDPNCSDTRGYFLNLKHIKLRAHSMINMKAEKPRHPSNQMATIIPICWMGNMTMSNASLQGVMHA
jgi:hypothetical protein